MTQRRQQHEGISPIQPYLCKTHFADSSDKQFVPLHEFETVTDALNFSTTDCHVMGSCDLYTTKAAGSDKKLYKNIEHSLESQHENLVRLSASLSPPQIPQDLKSPHRKPSMAMPEIDLSRDSPFGPLSQISARRTFAYLIATLNASHPDYDFSNILRPSDFRKTTGTHVKRIVDSTLMNMRPRRMSSLLSPPLRAPLNTSSSPGSVPRTSETAWGESMWRLMDEEMDLRQCEKYSWDPEDDPFEAESALWSQHYFFFNKEKKRVCYLNFRAFSVLSHSLLTTANMGRGKSMPRSISNVSIGEGAGKRAQYWLGHSVDDDDVAEWDNDDDDMAVDNDNMSMEGEYRQDPDDVRDQLEEGYYSYNDGDMDENEVSGWTTRGNGHRASSEGPADAMEI